MFCLYFIILRGQKSPATVEFDLRNQYKSLDDVSINSICGDNKWNTNFSQSLASTINMPKADHPEKKNYGDERRWSLSRALQCDKTTTKTPTKNVLVMKKDLQCDKCGYIKAICDETIAQNRCSNKGASCHSSDERFNINHFKDNVTFKSTNCRLKSESSCSLGRSSTFINSYDIHLTVRRRIVYAQVLLEAFGNASIPLNSNSSRFVSWPFFVVFVDFLS